MGGGDDKETVLIGGIAPPVVIVIGVDSAGGGSGESDDGKEVVMVAASGQADMVEAGGGCSAVDVESGDGACESKEEEKVCRICHLSADLIGSADVGLELIGIGCGCKGDLGIAHRRCAEAWFRVKGNRLCEICGLNAKSIIDNEDSSFMRVWHEGRNRSNNPSLRNRYSYWTNQRFCSFLVSFLVIAFILQWYFRERFTR